MFLLLVATATLQRRNQNRKLLILDLHLSKLLVMALHHRIEA
ncbi:hypothetical protein PC129_g10130 [Phytophthora cactorum]|uniref:Uncharacterized protein n=1 Tax=Phytophthora cactorum TaxID=29920 RepID=A0A8T1B0U4_9STRA|nr:hypothetical protein Pcac1_g5021 [Phytophthora cactorum]KAG2802568.1 hypothetical protein PC112_g19583 [Phytophthora cactorum]KAG2807577.1 hypothetical protein PC111_g16885 [Phytophthora cactorum]KAG2855440.1 hypothetical protein PC113_g12443 [Phytophthora cactorum]KAG2877977.1 hypothetical protein PC114_g23364 [Phytophthora cactorum]